MKKLLLVIPLIGMSISLLSRNGTAAGGTGAGVAGRGTGPVATAESSDRVSENWQRFGQGGSQNGRGYQSLERGEQLLGHPSRPGYMRERAKGAPDRFSRTSVNRYNDPTRYSTQEGQFGKEEPTRESYGRQYGVNTPSRPFSRDTSDNMGKDMQVGQELVRK